MVYSDALPFALIVVDGPIFGARGPRFWGAASATLMIEDHVSRCAMRLVCRRRSRKPLVHAWRAPHDPKRGVSK